MRPKNNVALVDCCWHAKNGPTKLYLGNCRLGSNLKLCGWLNKRRLKKSVVSGLWWMITGVESYGRASRNIQTSWTVSKVPARGLEFLGCEQFAKIFREVLPKDPPAKQESQWISKVSLILARIFLKAARSGRMETYLLGLVATSLSFSGLKFQLKPTPSLEVQEVTSSVLYLFLLQSRRNLWF